MWCAMNKSAKITFSKALSLHSLVTLPNPHSHFPAIIINICMKILNEHEANVDVSQPIDSSHSFLYSWIAQWSSHKWFLLLPRTEKRPKWRSGTSVNIFFRKWLKFWRLNIYIQTSCQVNITVNMQKPMKALFQHLHLTTKHADSLFYWW